MREIQEKELRRKQILFAAIMLTPFVIFAVIAFAPWWVSTPFAIVGALYWLGCVILLGEKS